LQAAYSYYLSKKSAFGEPSFFEQLPQPILYRLVKQMNEEDIRCVRLFHTYEMDFVVPLLLAIKPFQASAGDVIFEEGDICSAIVFLKKGKIAISSSNGFSNVLAGYVRAGGYFGDMEYLRRTTCVATYSASKHSDLLSVSHNDINHASSKCLEAGVRFRKENQVRYDLFNQVLHENKRDGEADRTQYTLEESRVIVDQLLRGKGRSPRRRSSIGLEKPGVSPRRSLVNTTKKAQSLWVDGAIVGTRNLNLLARNAEKTIPLELDVNMLRVIYVNAHGNISAGEVPSGYLPKHLVINPLNRYKVAWDLLTAILVFYSILIIPVEIAFNQQLFAGSLTVDKGEPALSSNSLIVRCNFHFCSFLLIRLVTDGFFLFDVVLNFRTAYFEDGGDHLVIVPSLIAQKYMSTWLVSDLLGSLPFDAIADAMFSSHTNLTFTKLLKVVRLVRLLKIMRLLKLGHLSELLEEQLGLSPTAMDLLVMLMQVFFVGHLVACVLYGVSGSITDHPWWSLDIPSVHATQVGATLSSKYILSLYWTFTIMSTVGYGDISPETTSERILNVFVILLGASMFGYMIANVSSLIQSFNSADAVKTEKISSITEYLDEKQCPYKIQDAVIKHFQNYYKHASPFDVDTILSRLPHRLASEIALLHNDTTIKHIAVLKYVENTTVRLFIFNLMKPVYFEPNEVLVKQGSPGNEILFVVEGKGVAFKRKEVAKRPRAKAPARAPTPTGPGLVSAFFNTSNAMMDSFFGTPQKPDDKSAAGSPAPRAPSPDAVTESGSSKKTTLPSIPEAAAVPPSAKLSTAADDKRARAVVEPDEILHVEDAFIDLEPMAQSPPPPLPHRANRFGLMHIETKHSWAEDSESDEEFEYASLRLHHSPLAATNASARVVKPATAGEDLFSTAGRQIFTYSDKKQQSMKEAAVETFEESDSEDGSAELDEDGHPLRFDPSFTWTEANMAKKGLEMVGDISPGDFVGHLSLMHESINLVSVVTATVSTVYTLNKQEITPLLSKQPTVAIHLQMALSRAISAQSDMLGKLHMRQVRSKFINRNKEEFYHKMGVLPREVKQIRRAQKNKMKKIAISIKSSVKAAEPAQKLRKQSFYLGSGINNMSMSGNLHVESLDATEIDHGPKHPHSGVMGMGGFQLRRLQSTSHIAAEALAAQVRVLPRKTVRKVKCVERVLNKYSMLYESDEENNEEDGFAFDGDASFSGKGSSSKKHRVHAHRTALPVAVANRSVAPPKPLLERRRRQSYILGADPASRRSLLLRLLSSNSKEIAKKAPRVNRVMSLNDLETLEPPPDPNEHHLLAMGSDTLVDPSAPPSDLHSRVVPLWSNQKAVRHEADLRGRRQSFPSLDNDLWKISSVCQGLL
jgi:potassium voltage-gated channel Eag-related subfamily H protein 7